MNSIADQKGRTRSEITLTLSHAKTRRSQRLSLEDVKVICGQTLTFSYRDNTIYKCLMPELTIGNKKILRLLFLCIISATNLLAQYDTARIFYDTGNIKAVIPTYGKVPEGIARYYYQDGILQEERTYIAGKIEGTVKHFRPNGKLLDVFTIENGKREGPLSRYDENGNFADEQYYSGGILQPLPPADTMDAPDVAAAKDGPPPAITSVPIPAEIENRTPPVEEKAFIISTKDTLVLDLVHPDNDLVKRFEQVPIPARGMEYFYKKLIIPDFAVKNNIQGTVVVKALINENGDVAACDVQKGIGYACDESAAIAVNYTKFKPALFKGTTLRVYILFPVEFKTPIQQ